MSKTIALVSDPVRSGLRALAPSAALLLASCTSTPSGPTGSGGASDNGRAREPSLTAASSAPHSPSRKELELLHAKLRLPPPRRGAMAPLTSCDVFALGEAPAYLGHVEEGDVAPYGVILMDSRDPDLTQRLLDRQIGGLWEYSAGYGPTSGDTALVLEGLLEAGVDRATLIRSLEELRKRYYDEQAGAFTTVENGRAAYWSGPSTEITAEIGYLMQRIDAQRFGSEIDACRRYTVAQQQPDGHWKGKWFPSLVLPTFFALRLLATGGETFGPSVSRGAEFLAQLQRADGSIAGSGLETAFAVLAWKAAGAHTPSRERAEGWLRSNAAHAASGGEAVLHYWFDDTPYGRAFFTCKDRGALAAAWIGISLRAR
jgi:hypothetical protein